MNKITPNKFEGDSESLLDSAIAAVVAEPLDSEAINRIKENATKLNEESDKVVLKEPAVYGRRRWLQLVTVAACVLIAAMLLMPLPSTSSTFAQFVEKLKTSGAMKYTRLIFSEGSETPLVSTEYFSEEGRHRSESDGTVTIFDASGNLRLTFDRISKLASAHEGQEDASIIGFSHSDWFKHLTSPDVEPTKELGLETVDGRDCNGFELQIGKYQFTIWVDVANGDLVQLEQAWEHASITKVVMKNFEYNQQFNKELFSFNIPEGYDVLPVVEIGELLTDEEYVVDALRRFTKISKGSFPKSLTDWAELGEVIAATNKPLGDKENHELAKSFGFMFPFLTSMSKNDFAYLGKGKSVEDEKTIVFWYRNKEGQFRAIYSDFTVTDISKSDLPK